MLGGVSGAGGKAWGRAAAVFALLALVGGLAGCGGGGHKKNSQHSASTGAKATKPTPTGHAPRLLETVKTPTSQTFGSQAKVAPSGSVVLQTSVLPAGAPPQLVDLTVPAGPAKVLRATATIKGSTAPVTISGMSGKAVSLGRLQYTCLLPPYGTICPPKQASLSHGSYHLRFVARAGIPIQVVGVANPVAIPKAPPKAGHAAAVAPYKAVERLEVVTPAKKGPHGPRGKATVAGPGAAMTAKPKQAVVMVTQLVGQVGAPQQATLTIPRLPARALTISVKTRGGTVSNAVLRSGNGRRIELKAPRYSCYIARTPTFCPHPKTKVTTKAVQVSFSATPQTPPLLIVAVAAPGKP
jgi:hypothetical protein